MSQPVTKADVQNAAYTIQHLKPAVEALGKIHSQVFRYNKQAMAETTAFLEFLCGKLAEAQSIIEKAEQQYANRNQDLILAATTRYSRIDADVAATKHQQQSLKNTYKSKLEELKKQQFSDSEIEKIVASPDEEITALETTIDNLACEKLKVQKFLDDAPRYDPSILAGTRVHEIHETNKALGIFATKIR